MSSFPHNIKSLLPKSPYIPARTTHYDSFITPPHTIPVSYGSVPNPPSVIRLSAGRRSLNFGSSHSNAAKVIDQFREAVPGSKKCTLHCSITTRNECIQHRPDEEGEEEEQEEEAETPTKKLFQAKERVELLDSPSSTEITKEEVQQSRQDELLQADPTYGNKLADHELEEIDEWTKGLPPVPSSPLSPLDCEPANPFDFSCPHSGHSVSQSDCKVEGCSPSLQSSSKCNEICTFWVTGKHHADCLLNKNKNRDVPRGWKKLMNDLKIEMNDQSSGLAVTFEDSTPKNYYHRHRPAFIEVDQIPSAYDKEKMPRCGYCKGLKEVKDMISFGLPPYLEGHCCMNCYENGKDLVTCVGCQGRVSFFHCPIVSPFGTYDAYQNLPGRKCIECLGLSLKTYHSNLKRKLTNNIIRQTNALNMLNQEDGCTLLGPIPKRRKVSPHQYHSQRSESPEY